MMHRIISISPQSFTESTRYVYASIFTAVTLSAWVYRQVDWALPGSPDVIGVAWVWVQGRELRDSQDS